MPSHPLGCFSVQLPPPGTAARGLARLLPPIRVGYDPQSGATDPYNRDIHCSDETGSIDQHRKHIPTPFVDLPLGATEDRVLGSIDFSATLRSGGRPVLSPGLLAAAHRGILYIDEVNLLPAHLVDVLLDASASGTNTVQREGLSVSHPARFLLVGTMNPEEGDLRPQLLDRFGLMVDVRAPMDATVRSEVVRQRLDFERDPEAFRARWTQAEDDLVARIRAARERLAGVGLPDELLRLVSTVCVEFRIASLRADLALGKTAVALAAWEGRNAATPGDVKRAARWVMAHRKHPQALDSPPPLPNENDGPHRGNDDDDRMDRIFDSYPPGGGGEDQSGKGDQNQHQQEPPGNDESFQAPESPSCEPPYNDDDAKNDGNEHAETQTFAASQPHQIKRLQLTPQQTTGRAGSGKRNVLPGDSSRLGRYARSAPTEKPVDLALDATLRAAAVNGLDRETGLPIIRPENWRKKIRQATTDTLVLLVVDASGSMSARQRMESVKGAVLSLLRDAYQQRDRVGVISFRGPRAEVLLEATNSVELAKKKLRRLPTGGRTPLAHALALADQSLSGTLRRDPQQAVLLVILSDGKANVPLPDRSNGDAWEHTKEQARSLKALGVPTLFLDTDVGHVRVGRGKELSVALGADYLVLEDLTADSLVHTIRGASGSRKK